MEVREALTSFPSPGQIAPFKLEVLMYGFLATWFGFEVGSTEDQNW